jgi:hypothetical protein
LAKEGDEVEEEDECEEEEKKGYENFGERKGDMLGVKLFPPYRFGSCRCLHLKAESMLGLIKGT